ncbi:MAG: ABC transporter ATP-binding protein [Planctomycetes bacterium]|nr:ABC transporter ATP-binding protein [Planctomycetota bacterium]
MGLSTVDPVALFEDVRKEYPMGENTVIALDGLDLRIGRGEYWAIMGTSGSGKSTLLNILGCLDRPSSGRLTLAGRDVAALDDDELSELRNEAIGFVFQSFNLIPQLTVLENIEVPFLYRRTAPVDARKKAIDLLDRVGLASRMKHRPTELSGGQQQRVAIARALLNDPALLLADEATGNLDSTTARDILNLIDELHAEGKTIVLVTHDRAVGERADRILNLKDGRVAGIEEMRQSAAGSARR